MSCHPILYALLAERTPEVSISHEAMPAYADHQAFVDEKPYLQWMFVYNGLDIVGTVYQTVHGEIGIQIFKENQGQGYGKWAVRTLMGSLDDGPFYANINPGNEVSAEMFRKLGFKLLQHTYRWTR